MMPSTEEEQITNARNFYNIAGFPCCIGASDCTHIKVQSPGVDAEIFRNRKDYFSLNCQAICDANMLICDLVCRWPGSAHDSTIFNNSNIRARLERGEFGNNVIVGDGGYPIKSYLMTSLRNPQTHEEYLYLNPKLERGIQLKGVTIYRSCGICNCFFA
ncbi:hypothetical protein ABEB36_013795 [Hypothenemus hampei]|uniref:Putative nuclease HARBI1 n=1 Tax=Hypothenemus hampei TaxID=57062 RepID=A0ABD1E9T6_HYPHA